MPGLEDLFRALDPSNVDADDLLARLDKMQGTMAQSAQRMALQTADTWSRETGTPFPERALPPQSLDAGYHRYEALRPIPVWEGPIAPAMAQPGGGMQHQFPHPIVDLLNAGYLREIPL